MKTLLTALILCTSMPLCAADQATADALNRWVGGKWPLDGKMLDTDYSKALPVTGVKTLRGLSSELVIFNQSYPGHILLTIEADVNELYASKDVTSGLALATLDTQKLTYEKKYYQDLANCRASWLHEFGPIIVLAPWVTLLLTLPDPAPEMLNGAAVLSAVAAEIAAISATQPEVGQQIAAVTAQILNVPVAMLLAAAVQPGG